MAFTVAGAQIPVTRDIEKNLLALRRAVDFAADCKADILLTPEGSLSGYTHEIDPDATRAGLKTIVSYAKQSRVGLALGTCFIEEDGKSYNQLRLYEPDGNYLGFHSKTLTCGSMTDPSIGEINHFAVNPLTTFSYKGVTIGMLICNDMWANPMCTPAPDPHLSQKLSGMGAKIIFHAVNGGRNDSTFSREVNWNYHRSNLMMRAKAGSVHIVTTDNAFPLDIKCAAPCGVIAPDGNWLVQTPDVGEQFFSYAIDL